MAKKKAVGNLVVTIEGKVYRASSTTEAMEMHFGIKNSKKKTKKSSKKNEDNKE